MNIILSNILSVASLVCIFASMQTKNVKTVLLYQIAINGCGMLSYVLTGTFAGCGIYLIAVIQSVVFFVLRKTGKTEPRWLFPIVLVAYVISSVFTFRTWIDLVPLAAAILFAIGIAQKKASNYRLLLLANGIVWMVYDLAVAAYPMLWPHIFSAASALLGIIRLDLQKKAKKT